MSKPRIIKKYPNRRLYDTEISSYIKLDDVRQLVLDHEDIQVVDAKTGDDLTRSVLLQIIAEHEEQGEPLFTTQLLTRLIRFYGDALQGFMGSYLERSLDVFLDQQQQFRKQLDNVMGKTPWAMMNEMTERNLEMWRSMQENMLRPARTARKISAKAISPHPATTRTDPRLTPGGRRSMISHCPTVVHRRNPNPLFFFINFFLMRRCRIPSRRSS